MICYLNYLQVDRDKLLIMKSYSPLFLELRLIVNRADFYALHGGYVHITNNSFAFFEKSFTHTIYEQGRARTLTQKHDTIVINNSLYSTHNLITYDNI